MALRDQPYLPLFIQDFMTDEKLSECSAKATGVYIRLMCLLHKSEHYGKILLKQKDKQNAEQIKNFASKVAKQMPYPGDVVLEGISELIEEKVLHVEGDFLVQKRMVKDCELSQKRAESGKKGGKKFAQGFAQAKSGANAEYESIYENENKEEEKVEKKFDEKATLKKVSGMGRAMTGNEYQTLKTSLERQFTNDSQIELMRGTCQFKGDIRLEIAHFASHYAVEQPALAKKEDHQILNKFRSWLIKAKQFNPPEQKKDEPFYVGQKPSQKSS